MKFRVHQISAAALAVLALLGTWLLYQGDFRSLRTEAQKLDTIVEYASKQPGDLSDMRAVLHPVLLFDETIGDRRVLVFTDSEIDGLLGHIQFRRGILGGWQPLSAAYSAGPVIESFRLQDRDIRVVCSAHCPPEIASYKLQANPDNDATLMAEGVVASPRFFHIHQTDRSFFPGLHLYDADGNELDSFDYQASDPSVPAPSIGSAETDMVYVLCALLLGVSWIIVKYLWDGGRPLVRANQDTEA